MFLYVRYNRALFLVFDLYNENFFDIKDTKKKKPKWKQNKKN